MTVVTLDRIVDSFSLYKLIFPTKVEGCYCYWLLLCLVT